MSATLVLSPVRGQAYRSRASKNARTFASSATSYRALPFTLNSNRNTTAQTRSVGEDEDAGNMLRMIMFGKPGAGKGTLSGRLVKKYDIVSISTGDLLRQHIAQKTDTGRQAKEIVARGDLLPDELMLRVVASELAKLRDKHWILDGFPRTLGQGELLDKHLQSTRTPLTLLTALSIPNHILRARIASRWVHPASGRVYNLSFSSPRVPGVDDVTGEPLIQRPDDRPEVFDWRLEAYERETAPLLGYYAEQARRGALGGGSGLRLVTLEGETSDEIWPVLERTVRGLFPAVKTREEVAMEERRRSASPAVKARALAREAVTAVDDVAQETQPSALAK